MLYEDTNCKCKSSHQSRIWAIVLLCDYFHFHSHFSLIVLVYMYDGVKCPSHYTEQAAAAVLSEMARFCAMTVKIPGTTH